VIGVAKKHKIGANMHFQPVHLALFRELMCMFGDLSGLEKSFKWTFDVM
jgi:hypothetical protein